jgi:Biotin-lipoyl like
MPDELSQAPVAAKIPSAAPKSSVEATSSATPKLSTVSNASLQSTSPPPSIPPAPAQVKSAAENKAAAEQPAEHKTQFFNGKIVLGIFIALGIIGFFARNLILGTPVEGHLAVLGELRQSVVASGRVIWPQRVDIAAEVTGRVNHIPVVEGQQVTKGQLLIQLEDKDERANLNLALASLSQAEAKVRQQQAVALPRKFNSSRVKCHANT